MARKKVSLTDGTAGDQPRRKIEIRPGEDAMLTFAEVMDVDLDPFFSAIVELLLERLEQTNLPGKEN